jgi:5-oxoprolinase (ATP-hydrolysing) subunit C
MFRFINPGLCAMTALPLYGKQDVGITPGGAMDVFSLRCGNILLGNDEKAPALEILFSPLIEWEKTGYFVLSGAPLLRTKLKRGNREEGIEYGRVYRINKGDILSLGEKNYGMRSYLCFCTAEEMGLSNRIGLTLPAFDELAQWPDEERLIRVVEGPEYDFLEDKEFLFKEPWTLSHEMSQMGMRLEDKENGLKVSLKNMVSEAVATGTIQLTPKGPIILMKHRQTVGGYPRIFNVITADTDLLGQYGPGQKIHFKKVTQEEALAALKQREKDITKLKKQIQNTMEVE